MKHRLAIVVTLLLLLSSGIRAQESIDKTIERLKTEIARREAIAQEPTTPEEQKASNRINLEKARAALVDAVQAKIAALQKYLKTLGDSITPEERDAVSKGLDQLSTDANAARDGTNRVSDQPQSATMTVKTAGTTSAITTSGISGTTGATGTNGTTATSATTAKPTLKVMRPPFGSSTALTQAELIAKLDAAAENDVKLKATVKNGKDEFGSEEFSIAAGESKQTVVVPLRHGKNDITVVGVDDSTLTDKITIDSTANDDDRKTAFTRAIFGFDQSAEASAKPEQKLFLEFNLTAPLFKNSSPLRAPVSLWLNPRITSLPKQLTGSVAEFSTAANFAAPFTSGKVNDIVQGFEFLGGVEVNTHLLTNAIASGFGGQTKVRFGLSTVFGAGMSTPVGEQQTGPQFFKVNDSIVAAFPDAKGKDFIAFVSPNRNRFFRQYYGGLRLKSYYVKTNTEELDNIFPGVIDITFGQNENVTGGTLHGGIARIDGIYPLPFIRGKYQGSIYVFGSVLMKLSKPKITDPIILQPADKAPDFPAMNVLSQPVPPRDADHYRIGVGVDLMRLLKNQ